MNSIKLVTGKMKDKTRGVAIEEFIGLKHNIYSFLVDNSEHKKAKKKAWVKISHSWHKEVSLNNKCMRHSMNRIQSKDHMIGIYEINKTALSWFDETIYFQNIDMMD